MSFKIALISGFVVSMSTLASVAQADVIVDRDKFVASDFSDQVNDCIRIQEHKKAAVEATCGHDQATSSMMALWQALHPCVNWPVSSRPKWKSAKYLLNTYCTGNKAPNNFNQGPNAAAWAAQAEGAFVTLYHSHSGTDAPTPGTKTTKAIQTAAQRQILIDFLRRLASQ